MKPGEYIRKHLHSRIFFVGWLAFAVGAVYTYLNTFWRLPYNPKVMGAILFVGALCCFHPLYLAVFKELRELFRQIGRTTDEKKSDHDA